MTRMYIMKQNVRLHSACMRKRVRTHFFFFSSFRGAAECKKVKLNRKTVDNHIELNKIEFQIEILEYIPNI